MNKLIIIGNLTKDADNRVTQTGHAVTTFTVAVNRRPVKEGQPEADFFRVTTWDKLAELCKTLTKGKKVCVVGPVSVSLYRAQDGSARASLDVMANEVQFLSPKEPKPEQPGYVAVDSNDLPWG